MVQCRVQQSGFFICTKGAPSNDPMSALASLAAAIKKLDFLDGTREQGAQAPSKVMARLKLVSSTCNMCLCLTCLL